MTDSDDVFLLGDHALKILEDFIKRTDVDEEGYGIDVEDLTASEVRRILRAHEKKMVLTERMITAILAPEECQSRIFSAEIAMIDGVDVPAQS